ncbi:Fanconi anemia group I protein [Anoplophora glabripennis]|nr:Fanconi anemia group I protein [Anoplophora glabripennis]
MCSIEEKISEYGQKRDTNALHQLISTINEDELINLVKRKINNACFIDTWTYILQSFTNNTKCHNKRYKMIQATLKELEENNVTNTSSNAIINRLCIELPKFKSEHLAELCTFCLECIQLRKTIKMTWKDLLPELLNIIVERDRFDFNDNEYTGAEYKSDFINSLCMSTWSPSIVTSLMAVFIDMPLTKEEHLKVVNKLGSFIEKMTPQEIPAFIHQLLRLCKQYNGKSIFIRLQSYFGLRIYNNANLNSDSSESNDFDAIESTNNQDTIEAESTVLYHIHAAASLGHECIKEYLSSLKNIVKSPEFVLHPFQLMTLFTISTIPHYEETVFDIVRQSIVRYYNEEQKKLNSCWFRDMVPTMNKLEEVFGQVVHFSFEDRDLVLQALVGFGFTLLGVGSALGRDPIAEKQWTLGNIILLKIIKRKRQIAAVIIQSLCNHIVTRQAVSQYIELLYLLSRTLPLLMLENQSCVVELMESLGQIPGSTANQLLDALIPLTKVSPTLRDHLIILLRKALYSRVTETRQMAVSGFLKLLTNLKISNMAVLSQSSNSTGSFSSGHSLLTQISMNRTTQSIGSSTFSNEALCLEVLSILKRCFMQQVEVRAQLYEGLYDAVCMNPELGVPILDLIWFHFKDYYVMDEDVLPPLNFNKIAVTREMESALQEPLGKLVYCTGLIVTKVSESEEDKENSTVIKFINILDSLCKRMINCELIHLELDNGTDLLDIIPESQEKVHILKEAMTVYEALIGYKICSWNKQSENHGQTINSLFQGYNRLLHFAKTLAKPKKGDAKKKKLDKTTQQTQSDATLKKDKQKSSKQLKIPDTVFNFQVIKRALILLHEPVIEWVTNVHVVTIKTKCDLHQHVMQATIFLVQNVRRFKGIDARYKKAYYDYITDISSVIFLRIIKRLNEFVDFDCTTAVLAMECFHIILTLITNQYKSNLKSFLNKVAGEEKSFVAQLTTFVELYQKLFETDEEDISHDPEVKKLSLTVISTLSTLAGQIPSDSNALSIQMCEWLKKIACQNTVPSKVSSSFVNLLFEMHIKYKVSLTIFEHISVSIGDITGVLLTQEDHDENFTLINEGTVHGILLSLCNYIKAILEDTDAVIARLKSEYNILIYPGVENVEKKMENLRRKELGVCCQLCFVVTVLTNLSNLAIESGNESEAVFKNDMLLFSTLSSLTKHFGVRSSKANLAFQRARFERLVKLAGKQLAPAVYKFILHIDENQRKKVQPTQKKKNIESSTLKSRVLRETRLIPKVIYEIEQFSKTIFQLSNKTKVDLAKYIGQGISRDFRISEKELKQALEGGGNPDVTVSTQSTRTDVSEEENNEDDVRDTNDKEEQPPPKKKSRT